MAANFTRPHHQAIALVLAALDGDLLVRNNCLFGGGTAITLLHGEYRESVDIDFLVSDIDCYRHLRELIRDRNSINALTRLPLQEASEIRADQYGIRTKVLAAARTIKFEIVFEGRIKLAPPTPNYICGIATLTALDLHTSKLLANSDRWRDEGIFNRDLIDLAMMAPTKKQLQQAIIKAETAYGNAIRADLLAAIERVLTKESWLERCMSAMDITVPKALLWKNIRALQSKVLLKE